VNAPDPLRLLVVDDHALFREGLALLLSRLGAQVAVTQLGDAQGLAAALDATPAPSLLLLDWNVPGLAPEPLIRRLADRDPPVPVLIVSGSENPADLAAALDAGALGFVPKSLEPEALLTAVRRVLDGELYLPAELARALAAWRRARRGPSLSPRQQQVLVELARGHGNERIARNLGIGASTVKTHVNALFNALGVDNRTACVHAARELGLLD
jgi:DNA-binding NarL/FixJ family response regulator